MADRFIDQDETQIYGPYAARRIRAKVVGLVPAFDPALQHLADQIDVVTAAVKSAVDDARMQDAKRRKGTVVKTPLLKQAIALLGRFSKHLDGHEKGAIDRKVFFTADGTAGGAGKGAAMVLLAVTHISGKLADPAHGVRDRETWHADFTKLMTELAPVVEHSSDARTDRQDLTPEVEAARQAWMQHYLAARETVTAVFRLRGRLGRLSTVFHDLAVPAHAKVTAIPEVDDDDADEAGDAAEENAGSTVP